MAGDDRGSFERALAEAARGLGVDLKVSQVDTLWRFWAMVVEANRHFNLTRITEPAEFAVKHCADSLAIVKWARDTGAAVGTILDVGTGAGVPSVPLCVTLTDARVTAIDGTGKKARFVEDVGRRLGLGNLDVHHGRAETWRGALAYDLVAFKAVGSAVKCVPWGVGHVGPGGHIVVFKTAHEDKEGLDEARGAARDAGISGPEVWRYELPLGSKVIERALWVFPQYRT